MKILITGSEGFIGCHLVNRLKDEFPEADLIGIDDLSRYGEPRSAVSRLIQTDLSLVRFGDFDVDLIIHLAAQTSAVVSYKDPKRDFLSNVHAGFNVAQFAEKVRARIVVASSNKVFRHDLDGQREPVEDDHPVDPRTPYGISKFYAERIAEELCGDRCTIFRQSCIYGDGQDELASESHGWVGWFMKRAKDGERLTIFGDGAQVRDLLHVGDLCELYVRWVREQIDPGTYVVGGGRENVFSLNGMIDLLGIKNVEHVDPRPKDQEYFVSANSGIRKFWQPHTRAMEWLKDSI